MLILIQYYLLRILQGFCLIFPLEVTSKISNFLAVIIYACMPKRRKIALENITRAFGDSISLKEKNRIALRSFQSIGLSFLELLVAKKTVKEVRSRFKIIGAEHLKEVFAGSKGAVLVVSHLGSWEYLAFLPYLTSDPWSVVVKEVRNIHINKMVNELRRAMQVTPIFKVGSIKSVMKELKANHGVAILVDQWAGGDGVWTEFFGEKTSVTSIPARLANKTKCRIVPAYCLRQSHGQFVLHIEPVIPFEEGEDWELKTTDALNRVFERVIKANPEQWTWGHRRWKPKPAFTR